MNIRESFYNAGRTTFCICMLTGLAYSVMAMGNLCYRAFFPKTEKIELVTNLPLTTQPVRPTTQSFLEQEADHS